MKIREITNKPDEVLNRFDYYNDYSDTMNYLLFIDADEEIINKLKDGYQSWLDRRKEQ